MSVEVQVLKINEHYVPSSKKVAALCELFPIEEQTTACDPWLIANELDKYRFFNEYLWYPWDEIEDDIYSWTESHLDQRIQLLYDMAVGEINLEDSERMRQLISDARHLQVEFEESEQLLEELEEPNVLNINRDPKSPPPRSVELDCLVPNQAFLSWALSNKGFSDLEELNANLHQVSMHKLVDKEKKEMLMVRSLLLKRKLEDIQREFEALEDPVLRKVMSNVKFKSLTKEYQMNRGDFLNNNYNEDKMQEEEIRHVALVCGTKDSKEIRGILDYVESKFSRGANCNVGFFYSLQVAIDLVNSKRTSYIVSPGIHFMEFTEDLLSPGTTLAGFPEVVEQTSSVIRGHSLGRTMMVVDWAEEECIPNEKQESANLENLHFDPVGIEAVLLVDCGSISVKFCNFGRMEGHHDLPVIGAHNTASTSIFPTYSHYHSVWKDIESGCSESGRLPIQCLPISAAFECPKQQGIVIGTHGKLEAKECHFKGLHLAIIAYSGAKVTLFNCRFSQCQVAMRIFKGAEVTAEKCVFEHSLANAIQYCAGTHEEQDEETQKIMEGKEELIASQILERY
ncbi:hypothetical protein J437_LFUL001422 [Ladona fulva]|uniref:SHC SH2 domain-containing protein n=1 Tax=Ladona fulva TaxID=123851 RepID=A0A8K0JU13_LADFU|nr:hypothetical protein J437_LFUL001422 [Ladona fulva]